jgi:hypothetical protein
MKYRLYLIDLMGKKLAPGIGVHVQIHLTSYMLYPISYTYCPILYILCLLFYILYPTSYILYIFSYTLYLILSVLYIKSFFFWCQVQSPGEVRYFHGWQNYSVSSVPFPWKKRNGAQFS